MMQREIQISLGKLILKNIWVSAQEYIRICHTHPTRDHKGLWVIDALPLCAIIIYERTYHEN